MVVGYPLALFFQSADMGQSISIAEPLEITKALVTSFFFVGSFAVMGLYMLLLFVQNKKQDYLLYAFYLLLFTFYFFLRIDDVLRFDIFQKSYEIHKHLLTPLLFVITSVYVRFINVFADIRQYNVSFSKRLDIFCVLMFLTAAGLVLYTGITQDFEWVREHRSYFTIPMHLYTLLALIRAFIIIKSKIRHYILWSNIFLFTFSIIGVYSASAQGGQETITSNNLYGFYSFNASQVGIFLEMICFSLGLGFKFSLVEKEKEEVTEKYIEEFKKNELVTKQLNEDLNALVQKRTLEIQKKNKQLQQEQELKSKFFTNISHEFRTPLTLISGPVQQQLEKNNLSESDTHSLRMVQRNAYRLLELVDQLLDISRLEAGSVSLNVEEGDLNNTVSQIILPFKYLANKKHIDFTYSITSRQSIVWYDRDVVEKLITNLVSNAIKFTPEEGKILCTSKIEDSKFYFEISNTGQGLSEVELKKVFDRFYQVASNHRGTGTGIGLALVKELISLNKGSIEVSSQPGEWTKFRFKIPVAKEEFDTAEQKPSIQIASNGLKRQPFPATDSEAVILNHTSMQKPSVLIIDDNDDMRKYLQSILAKGYTVSCAKNGAEGIETAINEIPDLIISDVMMPLVDGLEVSKSLKKDFRTSHIPIVLLTAKAGRTDHLEGLRTGAEDYVIKPFNNELLLARVQGLLENRDRLKAHYQNGHFINLKDVQQNSAESKFREQLQDAIEQKLKDPEFNTDEFCRFMGMSRMQLHRKLKAILGVSASEFLNRERLSAAKSLLIQSELTVSEIAYSTGFNSPNYFGRKFKKAFGQTPGAYRTTVRS